MKEITDIDDPVNVVSMVGPYRSGKSYLLNRLANTKQGFPLGSTTEAKTKGIWAWCLEHPRRKGEVLMLLDTEGIGDVDKGDDESDNNILCLATLLSGTLVYNMIGVVDETMLKNLSFVAEISKKIVLSKTVPQDDPSVPDIGLFFPSFVLCLRDFFLELPSGETPDSYFESCLKIKQGHGKKIRKYNNTRVSIQHQYQKRRLFVFNRPTDCPHDLSRLDDLEESKLGKNFLLDTDLFTKYIYTCEPKTIFDGTLLNGRMFSSLAEEHTAALRSGDLLCIDDALTIMSKRENQLAVKKAVDMFKQQIESIELPLPDDFEIRYKQAQTDALKRFKNMAVLDDEKVFQKEAENEMDDIKEKVVENNLAFLKDVCFKELQSRYDDLIKPKLANEAYIRSAGYRLYREDFAKLREAVKQKLPTVNPNLIQMCAVEFEGRYRKQDEEILGKADMVESEIKSEMKKQHIKLEREMSVLKEKSQIKRKEDAKKLEAYKKEITEHMKKDKNETKKKYEKMFEDRAKEIKKLERKIQEQDDSILEQRRKLNDAGTRIQKPSLLNTVIKTACNMIPVVGPLATGILEHLSYK